MTSGSSSRDGSSAHRHRDKPAIVRGWQLPTIAIIELTGSRLAHSGSELRPSRWNTVGITPDKGRGRRRGEKRGTRDWKVAFLSAFSVLYTHGAENLHVIYPQTERTVPKANRYYLERQRAEKGMKLFPFFLFFSQSGTTGKKNKYKKTNTRLVSFTIIVGSTL